MCRSTILENMQTDFPEEGGLKREILRNNVPLFFVRDLPFSF